MMRAHLRSVGLLSFALGIACGSQTLLATDYFLTIGGGYNPSGNQASLEANVMFFQQILEEKHQATRSHDIYFADGNDAAADLQILAKPSKSDQPATELLAALHRRRTEERLEYRNHRVPHIAGPLDPALVRASLASIAKKAHRGDRLIVYVTAHGSPAAKGDVYNTTIDCWNQKRVTAREFSRWLNELPRDVSVVMVMAQCYCGGFGHTIFADLDESKGLASQVRIGFFAQQHNLPAAGCRPDISNDEEFSSYFWGAIAGRSRTGVPIESGDVDGNGVISFAEAYAYAVVAGQTIDIPLRSSDVLLRTYSRLSNARPDGKPDEPVSALVPDNTQPELVTMTGSLRSLVDRASPSAVRMVVGLSEVLGFTLDDDVSKVTSGYEQHRRAPRGPGRSQRRPGQGPGFGQGPGRGSGSGRREFLQEVAEKWPELGDEKHWEESELLKPDNQERLLAELKELPGWKVYDERRKQMADAGQQGERHELREVKFRRLINVLECIVLDQNLPKVATPDVVARYREMLALEDSALMAR